MLLFYKKKMIAQCNSIMIRQFEKGLIISIFEIESKGNEII